MDLPWVPMFVIVAFLVHWSIGVLALLAAALVAALAWRNQDATRPAMEDATKQMAAAQIWTQSAGAHAEAVRSLGMTGSVVEKAFAQRREAIEGLIGAQFSGSSYTAASRFVRLFVQSLGLGLGALLAIDGKISSGAIIAASIIIGRALQPVDAVIAGWSSLASARAALHRLSVNLGAERLHFERTRLPPPSGKLSLDQVALKAGDGRPILFGITVEVEPGQVLAVIGPSGSGKTSLLKIMSGAIPATVGTVRIDGAQYSDWDSDELGSHVGYLPQQPSLLEGTIRDNICRFSTSVAREATDAAVVEAAIQAGVHELILQLPNGYDTVVAPMGSSLSAGQAQRIALARALYGAPSLIVLDEPNAWLDSDGEAALARAVKEIKGRRAAVVIAAHRRSVLEYADRVLVLDSGRPRLLGETSKVLARLVGPPQSESVA
jgi:ATP-binding cassette subfamily C protein